MKYLHQQSSDADFEMINLEFNDQSENDRKIFERMKKKTYRKKESKREETNIQKKILGHLKIIIKDTNWGCPIIFDKYFKRYGNFTKTRKIMDYEIICLSAENQCGGSLQQFKKFLNRVRTRLTYTISQGIKRVSQLKVLSEYLSLFYFAVNQAKSSEERIDFLYRDSPHKKKEIKKLKQIVGFIQDTTHEL